MTGAMSKIHPTTFKVGLLPVLSSILTKCLLPIQAVTGGLFGLALATASARTYIRFKKFHRVFTDDVLFFFAIVCLVSSVGLLYASLPSVYDSLDLSISTKPPSTAFVEAFIEHLPHNHSILATWSFFIGAVILSIKFVFMFHFRRLVERVRILMLWWWCVLAILVLASPLWLFQFLIVCPATGSAVPGKSIIDIRYQRAQSATNSRI